MKSIDLLALALIIIGGINWGLVGFFDYNLIDSIFGDQSTVSRIIYAAVGVAAVWSLLSLVPRYSRSMGHRHAAT